MNHLTSPLSYSADLIPPQPPDRKWLFGAVALGIISLTIVGYYLLSLAGPTPLERLSLTEQIQTQMALELNCLVKTEKDCVPLGNVLDVLIRDNQDMQERIKALESK